MRGSVASNKVIRRILRLQLPTTTRWQETGHRIAGDSCGEHNPCIRLMKREIERIW